MARKVTLKGKTQYHDNIGKNSNSQMLPNRHAMNTLTKGDPSQRTMNNYAKATPSGANAMKSPSIMGMGRTSKIDIC